MKKLTRSRDDKWLSGVIGGIAHYYAIDATIPRLLFILVLLVTGVFPMVIVYLIAVFVVPKEVDAQPVTAVDADSAV